MRYLVIEKRMDGSYCLRGQNSVKYPEYWEMLDEAESFAVPGGEVLVLPVDVNDQVGPGYGDTMAYRGFGPEGTQKARIVFAVDQDRLWPMVEKVFDRL